MTRKLTRAVRNSTVQCPAVLGCLGPLIHSVVPKHTRDCFPQVDASLALAACVYRLHRPTQQMFHSRVVGPVDDRRMAFSRSVRIGAVSEQLAHLEQHFPKM